MNSLKHTDKSRSEITAENVRAALTNWPCCTQNCITANIAILNNTIVFLLLLTVQFCSVKIIMSFNFSNGLILFLSFFFFFKLHTPCWDIGNYFCSIYFVMFNMEYVADYNRIFVVFKRLWHRSVRMREALQIVSTQDYLIFEITLNKMYSMFTTGWHYYVK